MDSYFSLLNLSFVENNHISIFTTFAKQSMINRLSNPINRNRSAAKISKVMSSSDHVASTKGTLRIHTLNKHEGVRFECHKCDYKATQKANLRIHEQAVHDGIVHYCNLCKYKASTKRSLNLHMKGKHG